MAGGVLGVGALSTGVTRSCDLAAGSETGLHSISAFSYILTSGGGAEKTYMRIKQTIKFCMQIQGSTYPISLSTQ